MSWTQHKDIAKKHFQEERYDQALSSYEAAVVNAPEAEKQILYSNMVACRLKIGGPAMAAAAVEEAKKCVALNDRWAKGHIRLASAYIALGDHSNDACNALQRAISLDPSNQTARQMLMKELRRDRYVQPPQPSAPPEDLDDSRRQQQQHTSSSSSTTTRASASSSYGSTWNNNRTNSDNANATATPPSDAAATHNIDDGLSMTDRMKFYWMKVVTWYHESSDDTKTMLKVLLTILILYVMMGGRFGLGRQETILRGNYGYGNAYDKYRSAASAAGGHRQTSYDYTANYNTGSDPYTNNHRNTYHQTSGSTYGAAGGGGGGGGAGYDQRRSNTYYDDDDYTRQPRRTSSTSFQFPNLFDGSLPSMMCLGGIMYLCHRNGINPFQVLMVMNMMGGGRRRHHHGMGMGMGGMGYGMGAMGYGMARNAGMFGRGHPRRGF